MDVIIAQVIGDTALVVVVASLFGGLARRCAQPAVVGQILAGILLGPSLLGRLPGHPTDHLFPHDARPYLTVLAQFAVVVFMFVVGYELDLRSLKGRSRAVPLIAVSALIVPMGLGSGAAFAFRPAFATLAEQPAGGSFVLFAGVALSITALPVLAAIIRERGIARSVAGVTATTAAGLMDAVAWLVLAGTLVGTARVPARPWYVTSVLLGSFVTVMLLAVRPALRWWTARRDALMVNRSLVALILALGGAWVTASLGIHPVFGAFLAGLTMPKPAGSPDPDVLRPLEEVGGMLLPLFFVVTGLSLNVGTMNGEAFVLLAVICVIAVGGKIGPAYVTARLGGLRPRDSFAVAALLNTRGLTELVALNVGLEAHIIDQRMFTILVLMALITTLATAPLLSLTGVSSARPPITNEPMAIEPRTSVD